MPGNPAAALITALVVGRPFLLRCQGVERVLPTPLRLPAGFAWSKANVRRQYLRARFVVAEEGQASVQLHPRQGSAMLSSACWADGLAVLECQRTLQPGDWVDYLPFSELLG